MRRSNRDDEVSYIIVERDEDSGIGLFVWGALIGAGVALLFAPKSGRDTRETLSQGALRLREAAEDTVRNVQETVTGAVDNVRTQVGGKVNRARGAFEAGKTAARESRADMERRIREARAGFESGTRAARAGRPFDEADILDEDDEI